MTSVFLRLFTLFLLSLVFTKGLELPVVAHRIQLPELLLLCCLPVALATVYQVKQWPLRWTTVDTAITSLCLITSIAAAFHPSRAAWLELSGRLYLFAVYALTRLAAVFSRDPGYQFFRGFSTMGWVAAATVVLSWLLLAGWDGTKPELSDRKYFPGWGELNRIEAFTMSPNQLANLLALPLLITLSRIHLGRRAGLSEWALLITLVMALLTTLSKSLVPITAIVLVLLSMGIKNRGGQWGLRAVAMVLLLFFFFNVSYLLLPRAAPDLEHIMAQNYTTGETKVLNEKFLLAESTILRLKKVAWYLFKEHPVFGIGPGNFREVLAEIQQQGRYPADKPLYDPHSTWWGLLAETGLPGLLATIFLYSTTLWLAAQRIQTEISAMQLLLTPLFLFFLLTAVEGLAMDILNFRHFWVVLGVIVGSGKS